MHSTTKIVIPFEIPSNWQWCKSKSFLRSIQYGFNGAGQKSGKYKMLRITDIQNRKVNWNTLPYVMIDDIAFKDYSIKIDDIFIARTGGTIGKSFRLKEIKENTIFAGYLIRFRMIDSLFAPYVEKFLSTPLYWRQVADNTAGTGQPNINGVSLSNLLIPIPPINEQYKIVTKLDLFMKFIDGQ